MTFISAQFIIKEIFFKYSQKEILMVDACILTRKHQIKQNKYQKFLLSLMNFQKSGN